CPIGINLFFELEEADYETLLSFDPEDMDPISLLFQTGYLTIKEKKNVFVKDEDGKDRADEIYLMAPPNREVRRSLGKYILLSYTDKTQMNKIINKQSIFINALDNPSGEVFAAAVKGVIDEVPSCIHNDNEAYYHSVLLSAMAAMGLKVRAEVSGGLGRADIVWDYVKRTVIIELKHLKSNGEKTPPSQIESEKIEINKKLDSLAEQALRQIKNKEYHAAYKNKSGIKIILVGAAVDGKYTMARSKVEII
ncbi:MAG: PD-(D/E)XK nuclease domain-containing protein, partial [Elusimicrobiota bacterium]|nr:PD-(D/E)XK nuclease domain-containing protein [Elusimicrobiota bacterium]